MEKKNNLNDTAKFNDPLSGVNMSMTDNVFDLGPNFKKEEYLICPLCDCKIIESNIIPHVNNFHKVINYNISKTKNIKKTTLMIIIK